jgi:aquaporin Z
MAAVPVVPLLAEFLGTFLLLTAIFYTGNFLAIGLTLAVVIFLFGNISGGHVNPAVSLAMYIKGSLSVTELVLYIAAQSAGAVASLYTFNALGL